MNYRILTLLALLILTSCAEGATGDLDPDTGSTMPDLASEDLGPTIDMPEEDEGDECGLCCADEKTCLTDTVVGICRPDGNAYNEAPCLNDQICEGDGVCVDPPVCEPGDRTCFDVNTVLVCRASGTGQVTMPCETDTSCYLGNCVAGEPVGSPCSEDSECVTSNCHCGNATDESCPGITQGYCAATPCSADTCGRDALCLNASVAPLGDPTIDYNHCVPRCGGSCDNGFACTNIPVVSNTGTEWETGCYFPDFVDIGEECTNDSECIGGTCLTGYFNTGYCSRRCDDDSVCPENAACARIRANEFWCTLKCGDGSVVGSSKCPLDVPTDRFDVTCNVLATSDGLVKRVCAAN